VRPLEDFTAFRVALPEDMNGQILPRLATLPHGGQFTYIHYLQPHNPYEPPQRFLDAFDPDKLGTCTCGGVDWKTLFKDSRYSNVVCKASPATINHMTARYRANIRYVDEAFGKLVDQLKRLDQYDSAMIVFMSDHGEAFFKHRIFGHKVGLYDDMLRIPLMVKMPKADGVRPARVKDLVATIDIFPTIVDYLGLEAPQQLEGHSLLGIVAGRRDRVPPAEVLISLYNLQEHAIRVNEHKLIYRAPELVEVYNVASDPDEKVNIAESQPAVAAALQNRLEQLVDLTTNTTREPGSLSLRADPRMDAHLNALGYVGGDRSRRSAPATPPANPPQTNNRGG